MTDSTALLSAATSNGDSAETWEVKQDGEYTMMAYGTWDGATLKFLVSGDETPGASTSGFADANSTFTADGGVNAYLKAGLKVYANIASAGGSTSLTAKVFR